MIVADRKGFDVVYFGGGGGVGSADGDGDGHNIKPDIGFCFCCQFLLFIAVFLYKNEITLAACLSLIVAVASG